tara:strand:- start:35545 stop:36321 length:777 start_codon:yes stop_codon:yes gene_type:complete
MCLLLFSFNRRPDYPFILIANRDEFFERPTAPAKFWDDCPSVLAGKDLRHGGSWMGVNIDGRIAAVTNYREPSENNPAAISRGALVSDYLQGKVSAEDYMQKVMMQHHYYNEFNLLVGDKQSLLFFCSVTGDCQKIKPGVYGVSNGKLDSPWPKVDKGKLALEKIIQEKEKPEPEKLFELLSDKTLAADNELPSTGVSLEWERRLSPLFVRSENYGTRSSTVLLRDKQGEVFFTERTFDKDAQVIDTSSYIVNGTNLI